MLIKNKKMKIDHVAYAVKSTDKSLAVFQAFAPKIIKYKILEPSQNVFITYLSDASSKCKIELVEPANKNSPISNLLKTSDAVIYHICYKVKNFKKSILHFKKSGFLMITKPFLAKTEKNKQACHFFHPLCGVIEIIE